MIDEVLPIQRDGIGIARRRAYQHVDRARPVRRSAGDLHATGIIARVANDAAAVSATAKSDLDTLAKQATALKGYLLEVEGFSDSSGNPVLNEKLSLERSQAVVDYLTENGGISPLHLLAPGAMGTTQPVASNETAAGRAENRRVTVKVLVNRGLAGQ